MGEEKPVRPRIPPAAGGIQVNFCKNPACGNFGVPATAEQKKKGRGAQSRNKDTYTITGTGEGMAIQCQRCKECPPLKSNVGILEELNRLLEPIYPKDTLACPVESCENSSYPVNANTDRYYKHGTTKTGSHRFRCKACGATVTKVVKISSISRHKRSERNATVFENLVNAAPLRGIARMNRLSMKAVYDKIDFIHRQCVAFASEREREYLPKVDRKRMEIAVDRQEHTINWQRAADKRNIRLLAVGSADLKSGYVFGFHVNYDPSQDMETVEPAAKACGDYEEQRPFRKHARFWLLNDYVDSVKNSVAGKKEKHKKRRSAKDLVEETYEEALQRADIEACDAMNAFDQLPKKGMQVHAEYTLYAHFLFLKKMLKGVDYFRFYLDQDSGMRAACLGAFADEILAQKCDAFFVKVGKEFTQQEKLTKVRRWQWARDEFIEENPHHAELKDYAIRRAIIEKRLTELKELGKWRDKWLDQPFVTMSEPEKMVCYLTNLKAKGFDQSDDKMAVMYDRASLHIIDSFFMQVRRLVSLFERPVGSSSTGGRKWYGNSPYRPDVAIKVLEIFRVYHNYVQLSEGKMRRRLKPGEKKRKKGELQKLLRTPAWRLGLTKGKVRIEDILYFIPKSV